MDGDFPPSDYETEYKEYNKRKVSLWSDKVTERDQVRDHEKLGRAKIEREGNSNEQMSTLQRETLARLGNVEEKYRQREKELDRKWEVIKRGIEGGLSWGKVDAMERIGNAGEELLPYSGKHAEILLLSLSREF